MPLARVLGLLITLLALAPASAGAQSAFPKVELPPEIKTLVRIKEKMRKSLNELPNYTCLQRIERTRLSAEANRQAKKSIERHRRKGRMDAYAPLDSTDKLEVEVALIDGKELYSWPGADRFEDRPLAEIVGFGTVSTGDFAHHARGLFLDKAVRLDYAGGENIGGRRTLRYDYAVSLFMSRYTVSDGNGGATVPYSGSIWADAETADLVRIEVRADEAPPPLSIANTLTQLNYARVSLGESEFLLPSSGRLVTNFRNGAEHVNAIEFHHCRAFGAESSLSFGEASPAAGRDSSLTLQEFPIPANVSLTVRLNAEISSEKSVAGDMVEATVASEVKRGGQVLVPQGSVLIGRIRRLERFTDPRDHFIIGLEFTELQTPNRRARLKTELVHVTQFGGLVEQFGEERRTYRRQGGGLAGPGFEQSTVESFTTTPVPGASELYVRAKRLYMPRGLRMVWRTLAEER